MADGIGVPGRILKSIAKMEIEQVSANPYLVDI